MKYKAIFKPLGNLFILFASTLIIPIIVEAIYQDGAYQPFIITMLLLYFMGLILLNLFTTTPPPNHKESLLLTVIAWMLINLSAAIPFKLAIANLSWIDAIFEATSGLTTTGAEIIPKLELLPHSLLFYHQYLQFLGGMGIIVLAITILPKLEKSMSQLDLPSAIDQTKIVPKFAQHAQTLWQLYLLLTLACIGLYWIFGMSKFSAICEAFATVSTGGFSIRSNSLAYYNSHYINWVAILFMLLGAINFNLHFQAIIQNNWQVYFTNKESKVLITTIICTSIFILIILIYNNINDWNLDTLEQTIFTATSMITTTGLKINNFAYWPKILTITLVILGIIGGCSGSTSGGIKLKRAIIVYQEAAYGLKKIASPQSVFNFNQQLLSSKLHYSFLAIFVISYIGFILLFILCGYDFELAFTAITACISNVGAALNVLAETYEHISIPAKLTLIVTMLAGRLELMTFFVCFTFAFWKYK